jgi:hypothetical protein
MRSLVPMCTKSLLRPINFVWEQRSSAEYVYIYVTVDVSENDSADCSF